MNPAYATSNSILEQKAGYKNSTTEQTKIRRMHSPSWTRKIVVQTWNDASYSGPQFP